MENRLRELREARKLTQQELADVAETSFQHVSRLERGKAQLTPKWLSKFGDALGVNPLEILGRPLALSAKQSQDFGEQSVDPRIVELWALLDRHGRADLLAITKILAETFARGRASAAAEINDDHGHRAPPGRRPRR